MELINRDKQPQLVRTKRRPTGPGVGKYDPETYPQLAYEVLASKHLQSLTHLADALDCTTEALVQWRKKYPEFNKMVRLGLKAGEKKFRDKLEAHAFQPQASVNNGLIKLLAGNVYGMREESPVVVINNNLASNPEEALKERGIPVPQIALEDLTDECLECGVCENPDKENCPNGL